MSMLKNRLTNRRQDEAEIAERISKEEFRPTQDEAQIVSEISERIAHTFRDSIAKDGFSPEIIERIRTKVQEEAKSVGKDFETTKRIEKITVANIIGLGPLESYINDPEVTEIIVQRYDNICIEKKGKIVKVNTAFTSEEQLRNIINRIVQPIGRQINLHNTMVDARLSDGSRVNATIPPTTPDGATLTIRKFCDDVLSGSDYIKFGSMSKDMLHFLANCVKARVSIIVSGGVSSGKTTLLNMLSSFIPEHELIITIEDSCELKLQQPNCRRMESKETHSGDFTGASMQSCVKNALRMRADRLIVGEIRDGTIVDMMAAMSTGHEGSLSTVHANSPQNLVKARMPILYGQCTQMTFTERAQQMQIAEALELIVHMSHKEDGSRKVTHITHVAGLDNDGQVILKDIFLFDEKKKVFTATGYVPKKLIQKMREKGVEIKESIFRKES